MATNVSGLRTQITAYGAAVAKRATAEVANKLYATVPEKTGKTRLSQRTRGPSVQGETFRSTVEFPTEVARYLDEGTPPHVIQGNPLLVFHWPKAGRVVAFRRVNHPGSTKHKGWFSKATNAAAWRRAVTTAVAQTRG